VNTHENRTTERVRNTTKNSSVGERRTARGGTTRPDECSRLLCFDCVTKSKETPRINTYTQNDTDFNAPENSILLKRCAGFCLAFNNIQKIVFHGLGGLEATFRLKFYDLFLIIACYMLIKL
jgi:hypothetical protein